MLRLEFFISMPLGLYTYITLAYRVGIYILIFLACFLVSFGLRRFYEPAVHSVEFRRNILRSSFLLLPQFCKYCF